MGKQGCQRRHIIRERLLKGVVEALLKISRSLHERACATGL